MKKLWHEMNVAMSRPIYWLEVPTVLIVLSLQIFSWFN